MQDSPFLKVQPVFSPHAGPTAQAAAHKVPAPAAALDELARVFNTAIVSTQVQEGRDFSGELYRLTESPAFQAILVAVRHASAQQGISERQAAEQIISTFRKLDQLWTDYVFKEGVDRLRSHS